MHTSIDKGSREPAIRTQSTYGRDQRFAHKHVRVKGAGHHVGQDERERSPKHVRGGGAQEDHQSDVETHRKTAHLMGTRDHIGAWNRPAFAYAIGHTFGRKLLKIK